MKIIIIIFTLLFITGCGPRTIDDFREEGKGVSRSLISDLKKIHNREELVAAVPVLKSHFNKIASLMIQADQWQKEHQVEVSQLTKENHMICDELRTELTRICQIDGGSDLIELCQSEALELLHVRDKALKMSSK